MKIALIHGYVRKDIQAKLEELGLPHTEECYLDGGYTITLASDETLDSDTDSNMLNDILDAIYDAENIPEIATDPETPVFVGIHRTPVPLTTEEELAFEFVGGVWGYDEEGIRRYQE